MYQPGGSQADEIIIEFDFMWSGQQVIASLAPVMCLACATAILKEVCGCPLKEVWNVRGMASMDMQPLRTWQMIAVLTVMRLAKVFTIADSIQSSGTCLDG